MICMLWNNFIRLWETICIFYVNIYLFYWRRLWISTIKTSHWELTLVHHEAHINTRCICCCHEQHGEHARRYVVAMKGTAEHRCATVWVGCVFLWFFTIYFKVLTLVEWTYLVCASNYNNIEGFFPNPFSSFRRHCKPRVSLPNLQGS